MANKHTIPLSKKVEIANAMQAMEKAGENRRIGAETLGKKIKQAVPNVTCSWSAIWTIAKEMGLDGYFGKEAFVKQTPGEARLTKQVADLEKQLEAAIKRLNDQHGEFMRYKYDNNLLLSEYANVICFIQNKLKMPRNDVLTSMAASNGKQAEFPLKQ